MLSRIFKSALIMLMLLQCDFAFAENEITCPPAMLLQWNYFKLDVAVKITDGYYTVLSSEAAFSLGGKSWSLMVEDIQASSNAEAIKIATNRIWTALQKDTFATRSGNNYLCHYTNSVIADTESTR